MKNRSNGAALLLRIEEREKIQPIRAI